MTNTKELQAELQTIDSEIKRLEVKICRHIENLLAEDPNAAIETLTSELESTQRMLSISLGCQIRQSQAIDRYRKFLLEIVPSAFEMVPAVSSVEVHKILTEAIAIIETEDVLPDDFLRFCEELVAAKETRELC